MSAFSTWSAPLSLATVALLVGPVLQSATAQQAATVQAGTLQVGTLTVEVRYPGSGGSKPLAQAIACVGLGTDQARFGNTFTGVDGRAVFNGVPVGTPVYVTAAKSGKATPLGAVQGKRINYVAKSSSAVVVLELALGTALGPNCSTPIGQEPPPSKNLPEASWVKPALIGTLKSSGGPVAGSRSIKLYTHTDASGPHLRVEGPPSTYQVAVDEAIDGYTTTREATVVNGRMPAINILLPPGDGLKTINFKLKNWKGLSPSYTVQQQFVDMTTPCAFKYTRRTEFMNGSDVHTEETLGRGLTRTYGGNGMYLKKVYNQGPHRIDFSFRSLDQNGHEQGTTITNSLDANTSSNWLTADLKSVRCF